MRSPCRPGAALRGPWAVAIVAALATGAAAPGTSRSPAPGTAVRPDSIAQPVVGATRENLQRAFGNEVNAKDRYERSAVVADREGYPWVARVFRACARAEEVHAARHVRAIAWTGDEARALLERPAPGSTRENLQAAIDLETYEATRRYPPLLAKARAEGMTEAVRSMNFALAAEREHVLLFTETLATLDQRPAPRPLHVCPRCGKTTATLDFRKCPNCFLDAREFVTVD